MQSTCVRTPCMCVHSTIHAAVNTCRQPHVTWQPWGWGVHSVDNKYIPSVIRVWWMWLFWLWNRLHYNTSLACSCCLVGDGGDDNDAWITDVIIDMPSFFLRFWFENFPPYPGTIICNVFQIKRNTIRVKDTILFHNEWQNCSIQQLFLIFFSPWTNWIKQLESLIETLHLTWSAFVFNNIS